MKNEHIQIVTKMVVAAVATLIVFFAASSVRVLAVSPLESSVALERVNYNASLMQSRWHEPVIILHDADMESCCVWSLSWSWHWWCDECRETSIMIDVWHWPKTFQSIFPDVQQYAPSPWDSSRIFTGYLRDMVTGELYHYMQEIDFLAGRVFGLVWVTPVIIVQDADMESCCCWDWWDWYDHAISVICPINEWPWSFLAEHPDIQQHAQSPWDPYLFFTGYVRDMVSGELYPYQQLIESPEGRIFGLVWESNIITVLYDARECCCNTWMEFRSSDTWNIDFSYFHDYMVLNPYDPQLTAPYTLVCPINPNRIFTGYIQDMHTGVHYHWTSEVVTYRPRTFGLMWDEVEPNFHFDANGGDFNIHDWGGPQPWPYEGFPVGHARWYDSHIRNNPGFWSHADPPVKRDGYELVGWQEYATGLTFPADEVGNLYTWQFPWSEHNWTRKFVAIWESTENVSELTFNANGGTPEPQSQIRGVGSQVRWLPPPPTRDGFVFMGWFDTAATSGGVQLTENSIVPDTDTTFWARWAVTLTFDGNGGTTDTQSLIRIPGTAMGDPLPQATRHGYVFAGWFPTPEATGGTRLANSTLVPNTSTTYYARWIIVTIYYENLVSVDSQFALGQADAVVNEIKHLFLNNFGVNLVQRSPARFEPALQQTWLMPIDVLDIGQSDHTTMRFRFLDYNFAGFGGPLLGMARIWLGGWGTTSHRIGDIFVSTNFSLNTLRFTVVTDIEHLIGAPDCSGHECVMNGWFGWATAFNRFDNWCNPCRTRIQNQLSFLWIRHFSYFAPSGASEELFSFADDFYNAGSSYYVEPYEPTHIESVYFYSSYSD